MSIIHEREYEPIPEEYDIPKEELLSIEEELKLIRKIQQSAKDSEAAMEKLISCNKRFVWLIAKKYVTDSLTLEDLMAEGVIGLKHAAYRYDETKGFKFLYYAIWWIKESIKHYIRSITLNFNSIFMTKSYDKYRSDILGRLKQEAPEKWDKGYSARYKKEYEHILPLDDKKNTPHNRAKAIEKYFLFDCKSVLGNKLKGLHPYAHHVNSSQLLCMMFFSNLFKEGKATKDMVNFIKEAFNIKISEDAICDFEYKEDRDPYIFTLTDGEKVVKEYEGTSFDFHIKDKNTEIYFEIKFTEPEFKKEKADDRHRQKAEQYIKLLPEPFKGKISEAEFLEFYQIFRNIIRAQGKDKYVIFITDGNNPGTNNDVEKFIEFLKEKGIDCPNNIKFKTWQEIKESYPCQLPFQFKAM